jgi:hypothetical protein
LLDRLARATGTTLGHLHGDAPGELTPEDHWALQRARDWIDSKLPKTDPLEAASATLIGQVGDDLNDRFIRPHPQAPIRVDILADRDDVPREEEMPRSFHVQQARLVVCSNDDSMIDAGIRAGDLLFVVPTRKKAAALSGRIVFCRLAGLMHLKRLVVEQGRTLLLCANPRYRESVVEDDDDFAVLGIVIGRLGGIR